MNFDQLWALNFLWIVPLAALAIIFGLRKKRIALLKFADNKLFPKITGEEKKGRIYFKIILFLASLTLIVFALSGPRWGSRYQEVNQQGVDIMIAVDVSSSMLAQDVKPTRMENAKREIHDFIKAVNGDRLGLVAFAGTAFVQCPLTLDYAALQMFLSELGPDLLPVAGTDIGAAIDTAVSSFDEKSNTDRVILLITDGEDNEGKGIKAAERAAGKNIKIFVFGTGDTAGAPVPATDGSGGFVKDSHGQLVLSRLDEAGLSKIATASGGNYVRSVAGDLDLDLLYYSGIKLKTESKTLKSGKVKVFEERFMIFVFAALLLLLIEGFVETRAK
ncbi:MAG: VWA domain-containing protein [Spirochaetota bacterium]